MGKQHSEMARIFKTKREKARAQLKKVSLGELTSDKLNRLARKIQAKSARVAAALARKTGATSATATRPAATTA